MGPILQGQKQACNLKKAPGRAHAPAEVAYMGSMLGRHGTKTWIINHSSGGKMRVSGESCEFFLARFYVVVSKIIEPQIQTYLLAFFYKVQCRFGRV